MSLAFKKILIANRGEIAVRIAQSCSELGIHSVAVYAEDDAQSLHVVKTDSAIGLRGRGTGAYLDIEQLIEHAKTSGCDAVHPGYGFLSENAQFSRRCKQEDIHFIGASPELLEQLGDKAQARQLAAQANIPMTQGINRACSLEEVRSFFKALEPDAAVIIKALAGGGGRGIRAVTREEDLDAAYDACQTEAQISFGASEVYVEQLIVNARHIEVQILGDGTGLATHCWDRECTLQRRNQKLIEIAPSPSLTNAQRQALIESAVNFAGQLKYRGLGTFEYLVDADAPENFYFMEVNPRIQVEHTVSEEVTATDLLKAQIQLAAGCSLESIGFAEPPVLSGCAIQNRINLESLDEQGNASIAVGRVINYQPASGPGVRVDHCGYPGYRVNPSYDSLIAKLIVKAANYDAALQRSARSLQEFDITGVDSNKSLLLNLLQHPDVIANQVNTRFVESNLTQLTKSPEARDLFISSSSEPLDSAKAFEIPEGCEAAQASSGGVIVNLQTSSGDEVVKGQVIACIEAMKMEIPVHSPCSGHVSQVLCQMGDVVAKQQVLILIEADANAASTAIAEQTLDLDVIREDLNEVIQRHEKLEDKNRPKAVEKRRSRGMRTARENIIDLLDDNSFNEYGAMALAAQRKRHDTEKLIDISPADGLIAGTGSINAEEFGEEAARCAALAYDYSVFAGTQGIMNHKKTDRVLQLAKQWRMPVVFFTEGGGGRPSDTDFVGVAGLDCHTFSAMADLSGLVPTVGIANGPCFAGNVALLGVCDVIIATESATLGMGGPVMIEGGGLGSYRAQEVGPVSVQSPNGVIDVVVENEAKATAVAKKYLSYFQGEKKHWETSDKRLLRHAIPENRKQIYDVRQLIENLADVDSVLELRRQFAPGIVTSLIRIEGKPMGLLANDPAHLGGAINAQCGDKIARFMQLCDAHDLPIISLCDTPGFMVGPDAEKQATVRHISRIFVTASSITVPYITLVTRKGYGLGAQAMAAGSFHNPLLTAAWPTGEFGAMGVEGAVRLGAAKQLDAIEDEAERSAAFDRMVQYVYDQGKALNMASFLEIDAVIDPQESRAWILRALAATPEPPKRQAKKRPCIDTW